MFDFEVTRDSQDNQGGKCIMKALITGHGQFAVGLKSAFELVVGEKEDVCVLPFTEDVILSEYQQKIQNFVDENEVGCIFTDLVGGTPFNTAMITKGTKDNIRVFAGTNLPMLLEFFNATILELDIEELAKAVVESGTNGVMEGVLKATKR